MRTEIPTKDVDEGKVSEVKARCTDFQSVVDMANNRKGSNSCCEQIITFLAWVLILIIPVFWFFMFKTVTDYERALIFSLGKTSGRLEGPGFFIINPLLDIIRIVDQRIETMQLAPQEMMTKDSVTLQVDGIVYTKVVNPLSAVLEIQNYKYASEMFSATSLRAVVGSVTLETLLTKREDINRRLKQIIERETKIWGVTVPAVEIKDVILPKNMQRAMAAEAETERQRRATKISALGEAEAAANLAQAAICLAKAPGALQLRYLHTLKNISTEKNSTIIFPLPMELMKGFMKSRSIVSRLRPRYLEL